MGMGHHHLGHHLTLHRRLLINTKLTADTTVKDIEGKGSLL